MSMLTVRSLDPEVKAKLRERAAHHGRSMEAEVRAILSEALAVDEEPRGIADSVMHHFAGIDVELDLPDRSASLQRPIDL